MFASDFALGTEGAAHAPPALLKTIIATDRDADGDRPGTMGNRDQPPRRSAMGAAAIFYKHKSLAHRT